MQTYEAPPGRATGESDDAAGIDAGAGESVQRARCGDRHAFEQLYRTQFVPVSRYVNAIVRDPDEAEDVTAETFLLAWRDLPKLRDVECFEAWLFRIARNRAMTSLRRHPRTASLDGVPEIPDEGRFVCPQRELNQAADVASLRAAIAQLPEVQRKVVVLRYLEGRSSPDIAHQLGKNDQAVWALTYRALNGLRRAMAASA